MVTPFPGMVKTTVPIDEFGEVRGVLITYYPPEEGRNPSGSYSVDPKLFSAKIGKTGRVRYSHQLSLEFVKEGQAVGPGWKVVTAANGTTWKYHMVVDIGWRKDVWLVGWGDQVPETSKRHKWIRQSFLP